MTLAGSARVLQQRRKAAKEDGEAPGNAQRKEQRPECNQQKPAAAAGAAAV
jgi:hypothetical protein